MLRGTRDVVLRRIQPVSIHGQISLDLFFNDVDDPEGPLSGARVGPESASDRLEPGDTLRLEYVLGSVIAVTRIARAD
jgi:hypothetical protein